MKKLRTPSLVAVCLALISGVAAMAAPRSRKPASVTAPTAVPTPKPVGAPALVSPSADDLALYQRFSTLRDQVDKVGTPGREVANGIRLPWIQTAPLGSTVPITKTTLDTARGWVQNYLPQLEAARDMPAPSPATIGKRTDPIKIDGVLDEPDWATAPAIPLNWNLAVKDPNQLATAKLLWDHDYLYVAYTVPDQHIIAPDLPRDGNVWANDCVEIFLQPQPRFNLYWELNIGPTTGLLDNLQYKFDDKWGDDERSGPVGNMDGLLIGRSITGTANIATDVDEKYDVELAIPWDQLPGMPRGGAEGDHINLLLARVNRDSDAKDAPLTYCAQVPYVAWLHNIWCFQPFTLVAAAKPAAG